MLPVLALDMSRGTHMTVVSVTLYVLGSGLLLAGGAAKILGRELRAPSRLLGGLEVGLASLVLLGIATNIPDERLPVIGVAIMYWGFFWFLLIQWYRSHGRGSCECFGKVTEITPEHMVTVAALAVGSTVVALDPYGPAFPANQLARISLVITSAIGGLLLMTLLELGRSSLTAWEARTEATPPTWAWHRGGKHAGTARI